MAPTPGDAQDLPQPRNDCYIVGDIHGRADLLELMLELIDAHIGGTGSRDPKLVFVGDYVDHGPESLIVLRRMHELSTLFPDNVVTLMGNHERMLLDFLHDPALRGPRWLRHGGGAALDSFGVAYLDPGAPAAAFQEAAGKVRTRLGDDLLEWLGNRPHSWNSGRLWVVHAGADPLRPMDEQSARVLIWGHPEFTSAPRTDGVWIAHGHVEVAQPYLGDGRIAVDTGAWRTDRLSACAVRPSGTFDFLQT